MTTELPDMREFSILKLPEDVRFSLFRPFVKNIRDMRDQEKEQMRFGGVFFTYRNGRTHESLIVYPYRIAYMNIDNPNFKLLHEVHETQHAFRREMIKVQSPAYKIGLDNDILKGYQRVLSEKQEKATRAIEEAVTEEEKDRIRETFKQDSQKADADLRNDRLSCGLIEQ